MKSAALKLAFWLNYILSILCMSRYIGRGWADAASDIPLLISSLLLIDITYISSCNVRENKILSLFCGLLAFESWYILFSFQKDMAGSVLFAALSPVIWYVSVRFILLFLFQGSGYKFQKPVNLILLITCIGALAGIGMPGRAYACLYGIQFLSCWLCFLFIAICHRKRIAFVLKSERKSILFSVVITAGAFLVYYFATINVQDHLSNFGIYLPVLLFFMSVHGIVLKEHNGYPLSTVFGKTQTALIICPTLVMLALIIFFAGCGHEALFIAVNALFAFIYLCNIVLGLNLKQGESRIIRENKYHAALRHLQQEEQLKTEFANFLHDDMLQDLLSVKNMMTRAYRPEIQDLIIETLDNLNTRIREQMQDYHPVILKNMTVKENYQNLIEAVSQSFPRRNIMVSFECSDTLFLVEPYHVLLYRMLKELLTNVFKHSDGDRAWVRLTMQNNVIGLCVSDDGTADPGCLTLADRTKHKGIASIMEQVSSMEGTMTISENVPHGICIQITIPMKGDVSYQYFVS